MKLFFTVLMLIPLLCTNAHARDDRLKFPIQSFMQSENAKAKLNADVRFFFGDQAHPQPTQTMGEFRTNKKTNAFNKSDQEACEWALLSALMSLQDRALREGGNAVINIKSNYKNLQFVSATEYECGAGGFVAGVALIGTVVKLP
jgi:uncharacterized protein YbjQ (UPF0145 family)